MTLQSASNGSQQNQTMNPPLADHMGGVWERQIKSTCAIPHEKINQCLTDINWYLTDTENKFYKISVILDKYWLSIGLYRLYRLNIGLLKFLP